MYVLLKKSTMKSIAPFHQKYSYILCCYVFAHSPRPLVPTHPPTHSHTFIACTCRMCSASQPNPGCILAMRYVQYVHVGHAKECNRPKEKPCTTYEHASAMARARQDMRVHILSKVIRTVYIIHTSPLQTMCWTVWLSPGS